jgi:hypothetical protein
MKTLSLFLHCILYLVFLASLSNCKKSDPQKSTYSNFSIYLSGDSIVSEPLLLDQVNAKELFIAYENIVSYDMENHVLELSYPLDSLFHYPNSIDGKGFVAVLDHKEKIYCGIFWSLLHSSTNPNICITEVLDDKNGINKLEIQENYHDSSYTSGYTQINDNRIIELFKKDGKLK